MDGSILFISAFAFVCYCRAEFNDIIALCRKMEFDLTDVQLALRIYEVCHDALNGHKKLRVIGRGQEKDALQSKFVEAWETLAVEKGMVEALEVLKTDGLRRVVFPKVRSWNRMIHRLDKLTARGPKLCDDVLTVFVLIGVLVIIFVVEIFCFILLVKKCICRRMETEVGLANTDDNCQDQYHS